MTCTFALRFSEALADIAAKTDAEEIYRQLSSIVDVFEKNPSLTGFLGDKRISGEIRRKVLHKLFDPHACQVVVNMLCLLTDIGRLSLVPDIALGYREVLDKRLNILNISVRSAFKLEQDQLCRLGEKIKNLYKAFSVRINCEIDPAVMAGVEIRIGDRVIDATARGRLEGLRKSLMLKYQE